MKKIPVDEDIVAAASIAIEQANIFLTALRRIANTNAVTDEGKKLVEIAKNAIEGADDTGVLSETQLE